jgi:NAD(P)-dependent dehydrogenase (short-subunit alcohol dehydrogenase family)
MTCSERCITGAYGGSREELIRRRNAMVPMKRMGTAWDVAYCALFLASDEARMSTVADPVRHSARASRPPSTTR